MRTTPQRDVVTTETVAVGSLAARRQHAETELLGAEHAIGEMLDSLYGKDGWSDWEASGGVLDVYDVLPSEAAVCALFRAGFRVVTQHQHAKSKFAQCACRSQKDRL